MPTITLSQPETFNIELAQQVYRQIRIPGQHRQRSAQRCVLGWAKRLHFGETDANEICTFDAGQAALGLGPEAYDIWHMGRRDARKALKSLIKQYRRWEASTISEIPDTPAELVELAELVR